MNGINAPGEEPEGDDVPWRTELRSLEARTDARFQAVSARFTTGDRRFAGLVNRVDEIEQVTRHLAMRLDDLTRRSEARFDAIDSRIDLVHDNVVMQLDRIRGDVRRTVVIALAAATSGCALIAIGAVVAMAA